MWGSLRPAPNMVGIDLRNYWICTLIRLAQNAIIKPYIITRPRVDGGITIIRSNRHNIVHFIVPYMGEARVFNLIAG